MILPVLLVLVLGVAAAALVKLAFLPDVADAAPSGPTAQISDPLTVVERGSIVNELSIDGTIARDEAYAVRSETDGTVTAVHVAEGATVKKGQLLLTIRQTYPVRMIDLRAPEAGEVSEIALVKGQLSSIGSEVMTLSPARHHVLATVQPTQLYRLVDAPSQAAVSISGGPAPFTCSGVRVQIAEDGTASLRCAVPADQKVFAGLPAVVDLALGKVDDALVVPVTAVKGGAGSGVVWIDEGDGTEPVERAVELGVNDGAMVEVVDGLAEGDSIRQYVPGFAVRDEEKCYDDGAGGEYCETGSTW
ncbi:efflux RND transporter periplasmic adaptor subunit [Microbacterium sp. NPDC058342]|uniref:efflux RND transporter periplasmic adaptor subunit n=1 Tax=Microbacterium sp. NPDC058342 TaxID=3346454 RepID=UPI003663C225